MGIDKHFESSTPTACVRRKGINIELVINEDYWNELSEEYEINLLLHECNHIVLKHLSLWDYYPNKQRLNIATDCEVNSFLYAVHPDWVQASDYGLQNAKGTKYYYENLPKDVEKDFFPPDDHSSWSSFGDLSDSEKKLIENQIDYQAKQAAEQAQKVCGHLPGHLKDYLANLFEKKERIFNWKSYFRRMIGTIQDIELKKTRKKESIRFPDASGLKHKKKSNICIVVDTSGSVSNKELVDFFNEIYYVWKAGANITIIENDAAIGRVYQYNGKWDGKITGRGGTVFSEAVDWFNERRKDYQTLIFFTDGYANVDLKILGPCIWVITSNGCKQEYPGQTLYIPKE